jgi:helix-turn-helix protein
MRMKNPPHPGRIVRRECIEPLGLTVTETAKRLGVTRQALNNLVNRQGRYLGRDGGAPFQSVRVKPGSVARRADGIRSRAG